MNKNILVLTGSPRAGGNSDLLADAFIRGAAAAGHEVVKYETGRKNISGCRACDTCFSRGKPCSFDDDFNEIAPLLEAADVIVLATPLYWFSFSAQIKAVIDKLYSFIVGGKELNIKESLLLVCGGETEAAVFEGIAASYAQIAAYQKWLDRGQLLVPGVLNKGDVAVGGYLAIAEEMGHTI
ncbi:MAG: flavodoxin family protein [Sporomusaceae bacterium]|nr:flavodoxin family protein [Sporomusaceae bacterium]